MKMPEKYYDDFSRRYELGRDKGYHLFIDELETDTLIPYIKGKRILEAGCGTGLIMKRLKEFLKSFPQLKEWLP